LDLGADGRLGNPEFVRSLAEAAFLGHHPEVAEMVVIQKLEFRRHFYKLERSVSVFGFT
jgi:hypothetical protein